MASDWVNLLSDTWTIMSFSHNWKIRLALEEYPLSMSRSWVCALCRTKGLPGKTVVTAYQPVCAGAPTLKAVWESRNHSQESQPNGPQLSRADVILLFILSANLTHLLSVMTDLLPENWHYSWYPHRNHWLTDCQWYQRSDPLWRLPLFFAFTVPGKMSNTSFYRSSSQEAGGWICGEMCSVTSKNWREVPIDLYLWVTWRMKTLVVFF